MKLRAHHLFCTALFSGHGYDAAFTEAMSAAISVLKAGGPAELLVGPDALCLSCPNRREDGGCGLGTENVLERDLAALTVLQLTEGENVCWYEVQRRLSRITEAGFQTVCGDCRWQKEGLCSYRILQDRTGGPACN